MTVNDSTIEPSAGWHQLGLLPPAHVMVEVTLHLLEGEQALHIGWVVKEHSTGAWIAAEVGEPADILHSGLDASASLQRMLQCLRGLREPF